MTNEADITFTINAKDYQNTWKHKCPLKSISQGTIGGRMAYEFTPTGVGVIAIAKCKCGWTKDLTDYELF